MVDLPGHVKDLKWGKLGPVITSLSELVMFFFCVDHEFHVRFDHRLCLHAFRPGRVRSGQPVGVVPAIHSRSSSHRLHQSSTVAKSQPTCRAAAVAVSPLSISSIELLPAVADQATSAPAVYGASRSYRLMHLQNRANDSVPLS